MAGAGSSPWGVEAGPGSSGCLCPAHPLHVVIRPETGWFLIATEPSGPPAPHRTAPSAEAAPVPTVGLGVPCCARGNKRRLTVAATPSTVLGP